MIQMRMRVREYSSSPAIDPLRPSAPLPSGVPRPASSRQADLAFVAICPFCGARVALNRRILSGSGRLCPCGAKFSQGGLCRKLIEVPPGEVRTTPPPPDVTGSLHARGVLPLRVLRVEKTDGSRPGRPEHEVHAPPGWSFGSSHSLVRGTREAAFEAGQATAIVRCAPGCACGFDDGEDD